MRFQRPRFFLMAEVLLAVVALVLGGAIASTPSYAPLAAPSAVTVGSGVTFVSPVGYANMSFANGVTAFSSISLDSVTGGLSIDTVNITVQKIPRSYPSVNLTFSQWNPGETRASVPAIGFSAVAPSGSTVYFNVSGLWAGKLYGFTVEGITVSQVISSLLGSVSFSWVQWSTHNFAILPVAVSSNLPPFPPSPTASFTYNVGLWGCAVQFTDTSSGGLNNSIRYENWTFGDGANGTGPLVLHAYACDPLSIYSVFPVSLTVTFADRTVRIANRLMVINRIPEIVVRSEERR